jgi:transposase
MNLTDEQWALIQPLITNPELHLERRWNISAACPERNVVASKSLPRATGGRPPADPRATLNGILRKIRLAAPWYDLPPYTSDLHPSWQTCYRRYRNWQTAGLMDHIYRLLYQDLRDRAGIDLFQTLQFGGIVPPGVDPACGQGTITLTFGASGWHLHLPPELEDTWQGSTVLLLVQVILRHLKPPLRPRPTRTLKIKYHHPEE